MWFVKILIILANFLLIGCSTFVGSGIDESKVKSIFGEYSRDKAFSVFSNGTDSLVTDEQMFSFMSWISSDPNFQVQNISHDRIGEVILNKNNSCSVVLGKQFRDELNQFNLRIYHYPGWGGYTPEYAVIEPYGGMEQLGFIGECSNGKPSGEALLYYVGESKHTRERIKDNVVTGAIIKVYFNGGKITGDVLARIYRNCPNKEFRNVDLCEQYFKHTPNGQLIKLATIERNGQLTDLLTNQAKLDAKSMNDGFASAMASNPLVRAAVIKTAEVVDDFAKYVKDPKNRNRSGDVISGASRKAGVSEIKNDPYDNAGRKTEGYSIKCSNGSSMRVYRSAWDNAGAWYKPAFPNGYFIAKSNVSINEVAGIVCR